jgi:[acyl-carrier-protein] S-malonyltransferase
VIAGDKLAIDLVTPALKEQGVKRVLFLEVSGAFHTPFMEEAKKLLSEAIGSTTFLNSSIDLIMNATGTKMHSIDELKENLEKQVVSIVYWQKSIETAVNEGINQFIEIGSGKTLTNMNKKMHEIPSLSIEKIQDLELLSQI